jgi:polar amino acid transport system permease protein
MKLDWEIITYAMPLLATGLVNTIKISVMAMLLGTVLGFVLGVLSLGRIAPLRWAIVAYVDFIRGTPLLIQIFLVYFALPVIGINLPEYWAGVIALGLNAAGFIAETVRGVVGSIEKGQSEAATSIGMTSFQTLTWILLPQALRPAIPPLTNELITLAKGSSLLSVISVYELTRAGQAIISVHFVPFEIFMLIALYYYVFLSALAWLSRFLERKLPAW